MEYMTPNFTKDMIKTHKILIPNMAVTQFRLMAAALECEGYNVEVLGNCGSEVAQLGLKYVHNDTCYPALLVIGQFIDALNSGKYDLDHTALLITQTGGGCRASNYIKLLRKALVKSGYGNIPVASLNFSGLEKGSGLPITLPLLRKVIASIFYGDMLCALRSQVKPYEDHPGAADAATERWVAEIQSWMRENRNFSAHDMKRQFPVIAADYARIPRTVTPKVKVGVVGEIYVKYSPLGNNDLEKFLESQDCEVNLPGLMGFVEYCIANQTLDVELYGGSKLVAGGADMLLSWLDSIGESCNEAMRKNGFYAPGSFRELMKKPEGIISLGAKMGEGWLLTAEMIELVEGGCPALRLPAQPHRGQGDDQQDPRPAPRSQHHPGGLRPQRHPGQPGKPHQTDAGRGQGEPDQKARRPRRPHRRGAGRRRPQTGNKTAGRRVTRRPGKQARCQTACFRNIAQKVPARQAVSASPAGTFVLFTLFFCASATAVSFGSRAVRCLHLFRRGPAAAPGEGQALANRSSAPRLCSSAYTAPSRARTGSAQAEATRSITSSSKNASASTPQAAACSRATRSGA